MNSIEFNKNYPVGTRVIYWPIKRDHVIETVTRTEAFEAKSGTTVVFLDKVRGCVALSHVEAIADGSL